MTIEQKHQKLKELIQNAVDDYVYETGDSDFSALVSVSASSGWTNCPEIKTYENYTEDEDNDQD